MKKMLMAFFILCVVGCGGDAANTTCVGNGVGAWTGATNSDVFTFNADCSLTYSLPSPACTATGTYGAALAANGTLAITIASRTGSNCIDIGATSCSYAQDGTTMLLNCGAGNFTYTKP